MSWTSDMEPDVDDDNLREKAMEKQRKMSKIKPIDVMDICKLQDCGTN